MEIGEETRVLIVDDFNTSRRMIRQTLKDLGTELCNEAKEPDEAIKLLGAINITCYWLIGIWMDPEV